MIVGRTLGKEVKNVFKEVKNNIWKRWCLKLAVLSLDRNDVQSKSIGWFLCNGNTGLKWQRGCMVNEKKKRVSRKIAVLNVWTQQKN